MIVFARRWILPAALVIAILSCRDRSDIVDPRFGALGIVYGSVAESDRRPLAGATVIGRAYSGTCNGNPTGVGVGGTDVSGRFRVLIEARPGDSCVTVAIVRPASTQESLRVDLPGVAFRYKTPDSIEVNLVLADDGELSIIEYRLARRPQW